MSTNSILLSLMKSVKGVFKKRLSPYNLRSRRSAIPVVQSSTPKVNRETQASLSEEDNFSLLRELPYQATNPREISEPVLRIQSGDQPRHSTAYSNADQADITNRATIDISIDPRTSIEYPPIVQSSSSKHHPPGGLRQGSESSSLEDFSPLDSRSTPRIALEVEQISKDTERPRQELSAAGNSNSPADILNQVETRIHYENSKENSKQKSKQKSKQTARRARFESSSSDDLEDTLSTCSREDSEDQNFDSAEDPAKMDRKLFEEQQRLLTALTQKLAAKDIRIDKFRGYETDDINRWFEKLELQLEAKGIRTIDSVAISQVVNNLSGPAETFMFELPSHERKDYTSLKQALQRRYSTKDRTWVRRQRLVSRKQGQHEPLSDYINEMHELFGGLDMGEAEKVTYFTEGLHQSLKVKVLERMPETLFEAEEIARTVDSISRRVNQPSNDVNLEKMVQSLLLQNAELTTSLGKLNNPAGPTVKAPSTRNVVSLDGPPAVAVLNDSLQGNGGNSDALRNEIRRLGEMFQKLSREMDARFRGIARRTQAPRVEQTRERTRDGRPTCFTCGRTGHLQISCPERRNPGYRSQIQPQQGTQRPNYSENPRYNQPRENYQSFPQQNRRDQRLAVLDEDWYDDEFVAQFRQGRSEQAYSDFNPEHRRASIEQENVEILSNDTVMFSSQRSQNGVNLRQDLTPPRPRMLPSNDAIIRPQSLSAQLVVKQPPISRRLCLGPDLARPDINISATQPTQPQANVDANALLEPILRAIQELKTNGAQTPTLEEGSTRPGSDVKENVVDIVPENVSTAAQSFNDSSGLPVDTQPSSTEMEHGFPVPTPIANNGYTAATSREPKAPPTIDPGAHFSTESCWNPEVDNIGNLSGGENSAYSSPGPTPEVNSQGSPAEPSAGYTLGHATTSGRQCQPNAPVDDALVDATKEEGVTPLAPVSAQQSAPEFHPKPRDLTVSARVLDQEIKLLVDTGAGISVMDEALLRKIYADQLPALHTSSSTQVKTVSGEALPILGAVNVTLEVAGGTYPCEFHVVKNLSYEAVLGRDFLRANGAVINLGNGTLQLDDSPPDNPSEETCSARAWSTCVIPPQSESTIPAYLDAKWSPGIAGLLEASPRVVERYQLQGAAALVVLSADHTVPFRLINPTQKPVTLYRGATLGKFTKTADAQCTQRALNFHVNRDKAKSLASVEQTSRQPVCSCNLTFEGEEISPDHVLAALPKQEKTNGQEKAANTTQLQQEVRRTRANKRQPQISCKQVSLPTTNHRQSKSVAQQGNDFSSAKKESMLKCSDLTTEGEIAGQAVQLLVDTGACVSAIDEQFFAKMYGQFPPNRSEGSLSSVQTVSGEKVPVLGKITIPLQLQGREYTCEFHVMQNLAYDAILGRDFLQKNGALIDLVDRTLTFKETGYVGEQASTKTVPVMGTFLSQQKWKNNNAVASVANLAPFPGILKSKGVLRNEKSKLMFSHQSLQLLLLIVLYLLTASCTPHTESNDIPVIQKLPKFFAQETPDDIVQYGYKTCAQVTLANRKQSDQSEVQNERKVPRVKTLKSAVSLFETSDVQETLKTIS